MKIIIIFVWLLYICLQSNSMIHPSMRITHFLSSNRRLYSSSSTIHPFTLLNREIFLKRDDLLGLNSNNLIRGNKVRKLTGLEKILDQEKLKDKDSSIFSYGGLQSNFLNTLSALSCDKNAALIYFSPSIPTTLLNNPIGNFKNALLNGTKIISLPNHIYNQITTNPLTNFTHNYLIKLFEDYYKMNNSPLKLYYPSSTYPDSFNIIKEDISLNSLLSLLNPDSFFIPQGGYHSFSYDGMKELAQEIIDFIKEQDDLDISNKDSKWTICFASGTGTSAYFFNKFIKSQNNSISSRIYTLAVPCVGDENYLMECIIKLDSFFDSKSLSPEDQNILNTIIFNNTSIPDKKIIDTVNNYYKNHQDQLPYVLTTMDSKKKYFASLYKTHLNIWKKMEEDGIIFDLIYIPRMIEIMFTRGFFPNFNVNSLKLSQNNSLKIKDIHSLSNNKLIIYHCGGIEGNDSQLMRYKNSKKIKD